MTVDEAEKWMELATKHGLRAIRIVRQGASDIEISFELNPTTPAMPYFAAPPQHNVASLDEDPDLYDGRGVPSFRKRPQ